MAERGRPRQFDEHDVLEAAMVLFWDRGYDATSLNDLRGATGLSSASIYQAFGSKEGLFEKVVAHYVSRPGSVMSLTSGSDLPWRGAVARLLHRTIDEQVDDSHPVGCLIALAATVGPPDNSSAAGRVLARQRANDRAAIRSFVLHGLGDAGRDLARTDALTTVLHAFILGIATQLRDGAGPEELHAAADEIVELATG